MRIIIFAKVQKLCGRILQNSIYICTSCPIIMNTSERTIRQCCSSIARKSDIHGVWPYEMVLKLQIRYKNARIIIRERSHAIIISLLTPSRAFKLPSKCLKSEDIWYSAYIVQTRTWNKTPSACHPWAFALCRYFAQHKQPQRIKWHFMKFALRQSSNAKLFMTYIP